MEYRGFTAQRLASYIDHSVLSPIASRGDVVEGARVALEFGVAAFCVRPMDVTQAVELLRGSSVKVATVIGFPHGTSTPASKLFEATEALSKGAVELDMVMNVAVFLERYESDYLVDEIRAITELAHSRGAIVKVIIETAHLPLSKDWAGATDLVAMAGADFVKTSTGFAKSGATVENVRILRGQARGMGVKASGGIRTLDQVIDLIEAGATRVGLSGTLKIFEEFATKGTKS